MKILLLTTHINVGGITSYLLILVKGLVANKHQVIICSSGGQMAGAFEQAGAKVVKVDVKTKSILNPKLFLAAWQITKLVKKENVDVIHAHTRVSQFVAWLVSRQTKIPFVSTCHGFFKAHWSRKFLPCWGKKVIAISSAVADHLRRDFAVDLAQIVLVPSGIPLTELLAIDEQKRNIQRKQLNVKAETVLLGIIARLSDVKGQDVLIEAMREVVIDCPQVRLLIAGEGKMGSHLRQMVKNFHLTEYIIFSPIMNKTADLLAAFDIFVMPSRMEGLGLSVLEAQAAGVPVVASRVGGIVSLITDYKTGFFADPGNSRDLAKVLISVIKREDYGKAVGLAGREFVKNANFLEKMIQGTMEVYKEVKLTSEK